MLDGIDGTDYTDNGKTYTVRVKTISNEWDVVASFLADLRDNPLDKNKSAQDMLVKVLLKNDLLVLIPKMTSLTPAQQQ